MDEIVRPLWDEFTIVKVSDLADPAANVIVPVFGADVEEIAKLGPPREPNATTEIEGKMERTAI